jgi:hypothetical protein
MSVALILAVAEERHLIMEYVANVLRVAGSHSVNPVIYGILDKKLLTFWKLCPWRKRTNLYGPRENQAFVVDNRTIETTFIDF